jgi:hypothetical protein
MNVIKVEPGSGNVTHEFSAEREEDAVVNEEDVSVKREGNENWTVVCLNY